MDAKVAAKKDAIMEENHDVKRDSKVDIMDTKLDEKVDATKVDEK